MNKNILQGILSKLFDMSKNNLNFYQVNHEYINIKCPIHGCDMLYQEVSHQYPQPDYFANYAVFIGKCRCRIKIESDFDFRVPSKENGE